MTTIAFRDGLMASDSCLVCEDKAGNARYTGLVDKIYALKDGSLLGMSGDAEGQPVIDILESGATNEEMVGLLAEVDCVCECLLVRTDGKMFHLSVGEEWAEFIEFRDKFAAVGTGRDFAYGAMECDATALQAVQAASRRHPFTRPPFVVMTLKDGKRYTYECRDIIKASSYGGDSNIFKEGN